MLFTYGTTICQIFPSSKQIKGFFFFQFSHDINLKTEEQRPENRTLRYSIQKPLMKHHYKKHAVSFQTTLITYYKISYVQISDHTHGNMLHIKHEEVWPKSPHTSWAVNLRDRQILQFICSVLEDETLIKHPPWKLAPEPPIQLAREQNKSLFPFTFSSEAGWISRRSF